MKPIACALLALALAPPLAAGESSKAETRTYHVPYRLTATNHVLVRVKINGKGPYNFILDTGAPALFVSTAVCRKLGIPADRKGWGRFARFEIEGGVVLTNATGRIEDLFQLEGMNGLGLAGAELHGILGYTILARYRLEFDFTKHKMAWEPLAFEPRTPLGLGVSAPTGMDALGSLLKLLGTLLGKKPEPEVVLRGFLGIALADGGGAVVVRAVLANSPAADAGLRAGDRILRFQGKAVHTAAEVHHEAAQLAPEQAAQLTVTRDGHTLAVRIRAGKGL